MFKTFVVFAIAPRLLLLTHQFIKNGSLVGNLGLAQNPGNHIVFDGDAFDFLFRSNTRNLKIIKKHLDKHHPGTIIIDQ